MEKIKFEKKFHEQLNWEKKEPKVTVRAATVFYDFSSSHSFNDLATSLCAGPMFLMNSELCVVTVSILNEFYTAAIFMIWGLPKFITWFLLSEFNKIGYQSIALFMLYQKSFDPNPIRLGVGR